MKKIGLLIVFVSMVLFGGQTVKAQDQNLAGPEYVVQPGDTLTAIAVRFGITLEELTDANEITNPNQVFVGDVLVIPGIEWVSGLLDVRDVPVGETFRSLRRRYQLDPAVMGRVGGIVSPSQVYADYPLMIPSGIGEDWDARRAGLAEQASMMSLAAEQGVNPWELAYKNQFSGLWQGVSSDVLLVPGTNDPGPGALPSPLSIALRKGEFSQGKTVVLEVDTGGEQVALSGEFIGKTVNFFQESEGTYVALQGVHVMTEPGPYMLTITGDFGEGNKFEFSQLVRVSDGGYDSESITVDPLYLDEVVDQAESDFVASYTAPATPEKMWSGYFEQPTPFDIFINSSFGTRRSYNGSAYDRFHSGVDFGGGEGADVICPAGGTVVFAGQLEVRGNATIIDHGWGIYTGYWHQSELYVQVGDVVAPGQIIGLVGNTGRSSGAHLHWELWAGGVQVEPLDWLVEIYP
jgi:murein DD-endopeptidase MepM/ murein hydrolase activator NlpD